MGTKSQLGRVEVWYRGRRATLETLHLTLDAAKPRAGVRLIPRTRRPRKPRKTPQPR